MSRLYFIKRRYYMVEILGNELDPKAVGIGVIGAVVCGIVTKAAPVGMIWKILSMVAGFIVGTLYAQWQMNKG